jgi:hypothetical protein
MSDNELRNIRQAFGIATNMFQRVALMRKLEEAARQPGPERELWFDMWRITFGKERAA